MSIRTFRVLVQFIFPVHLLAYLNLLGFRMYRYYDGYSREEPDFLIFGISGLWVLMTLLWQR